jgi:hypothetical protein
MGTGMSATEQDLYKIFRVADVEQTELELVLQARFGFVWAQNLYEILYGDHTTRVPALILRYGKEGRLKEIVRGPRLTPDDISQITEKVQMLLLGPTKPRTGQMLLFSRMPVTGWFRYRDRFQLIPLPPEAPRPTTPALGGYPLIIQYCFEGSSDAALQNYRQFRARRELELLIAALSHHIEGSIPQMMQYHWTTISKGPPPLAQPEYCPEAYYWPGASDLTVVEYSTVDQWMPVPRLPHQEYYAQLNMSVGRPMMLPDSFEELLGAYFNREPDERDRFLRASYWYQIANRTARRSNTASYSALCSAVEALMGPECPHCLRKNVTGLGRCLT